MRTIVFDQVPDWVSPQQFNEIQGRLENVLERLLEEAKVDELTLSPSSRAVIDLPPRAHVYMVDSEMVTDEQWDEIGARTWNFRQDLLAQASDGTLEIDESE